MSRRKQSNPRHLDGENDNRPTPIFPPEYPQAADADPNPLVPGNADSQHANEEYTEPVTCANCQEEFRSAWDLMAHEKVCCAVPIDTMPYDELNEQAGESVSGPNSGLGSEEGEEKEEEEVEEEGMYQEELLSRVRGELMGEDVDEEMDEDLESGVQSDQDDYMAVPLSMAAAGVVAGRDGYPFINPEQGKSEENKENNSGLGNQNDEGEDSIPSSGEAVTSFNPSMASLPGMFPGNNVTLEPMAATKAAVAQFPLAQAQLADDAEGAQKALEELKQRDLINQQIIRSMQALMMKRGINITELMPEMYMMGPQMGFPPMDMTAASVMSGSHSMAAYLTSQAEKLQKEQKAQKEDGPKDLSKDLGKDFSKDIEQVIKRVDQELNQDSARVKQEPDNANKPASSVPSSTSSSSTSSFLSSLSSSSSAPVTSSSLSALSSMTNGSGLGLGGSGGLSGSIKQEGGRTGGNQYSSSSLSALQRETDALKSSILPQLHMPMTPEEYRGYCQRGTVLERSQYACDDPFFKHKCRFCHKVFGSDSALQIHVRSHTGERPFKCNICGNRFSTKGNLKVHFERHKAKYPHVKMNPNPVPEHFDRLPPVVPPPMSSSTPIPSSLPLPSGMMHAEPHSPAMPRMMLPPGGPGGFFPPTSMGLSPGFVPHPYGRLPAPHPMMPGPPRGLLSPPHPKSDPLPSPSPKHSPRDTPKSGGSDAGRSPSRAEGDFSAPSSHGSSEKPSSSRASSPRPSSSVPPASARSEPGTPVSSMSALASPPIPPLIPAHPPLPGHHPLSLSSPHPLPHTPGPIFSNHSLPATPTSFPLPSPLNSTFPGMMRGGHAANPFAPPPALPAPAEGMFRNSILPTKTIDPSENLEQYMEIQKSETSKLEQMVNSIPDKVREPNQCVICQRVLSCKSALQMHYRIHTGERPFKCKICNRKFTTKGNLKTHMGVHRSKPALRMQHVCPICHKPFNNVLVLQQHLRIHGPTGPMLPMPMFPHLPSWPAKTPLPPGPMMGFPQPHHKPHEPFDLSRQHEPRELDLSNKRLPVHSDSDNEAKNPSSFADEGEDGSPTEEDERMNEEAREEEEAAMEDDGDEGMLDERDEEGYNFSRDGGSSGPASQGPQSAFSDNGDSDRPDSNVSAAYSGFDVNQPLPPTPDVMDAFLNPSLPPPRGVANPSLAALEDHVKNIESSVAQSGFERFRNSMGFGAGPFLMDKSFSPGGMMHPPCGGSDKSPVSPRSQGASEAGSDGGREESKFFMSDFPMNPLGFPVLGLDSGRGQRNNTTCHTCFKTFACRSALDIHLRSHTKERPFKCDDCDRAFSTRGNLKQHQLTHKPGGESSGDGDMDLENSSLRGNGMEQDEDSGPTPDKPHTESPHSQQPNKPQSDSQVDGNSGSSQNSELVPPSSSQKQLLPPPHLHSSSSSSSSSNGNNSSPSNNSHNHNNNNNNTKTFPDGNTVKKELSPAAPTTPRDGDLIAKRPKHMCEVCMKPFSSASALQIHTRTHTGDKPFKCSICSKAFTTRGNLKVHMGTHMYHNSPSRRGRRMSIDTPFLFPGNPYLAAAAAGFHHGPPRPPPPPDMFYQYQNLMNGIAPPRSNEIPVIQSANGGIGHHLPPMYPGFPTHPFPTHPGGDEALKHPADLSLSRSHSDSGVGERERERRREMDREPSPVVKRPRERSLSPLPASSSSSSSLMNGSADMAGTITSTGELDLSMKSATPQSSPPKTSPKPAAYPPSPAVMTSPVAKTQSLGDRASAGSPPPPPLPPTHLKDKTQENVLSSPKSWMWNAASCHHCGQSFPSTSALEQHIQSQHFKNDSHTSGQKAITA